MNISRKYIIFFFCLIAFAVAAYFFLPKMNEKNESLNSEGFRNLKVETFQKETGWGYRIFSDTSAIIEQLYLPGIPGTKGFSTEALATKTGELVKSKLQNGVFPPTVTPQELDSLGVRF